MPKHPARQAMESSLKSIVVPDLRARGFQGSFPHFRRISDERIDLLTFQFYSSGGSFVAEIGSCRPQGTRWSPPSKAKVHEVALANRLRLGASAPGSDHWFEFGLPNYEPGHDRVQPKSHYDSIANEVVQLIDGQAEEWWSNAA